LKGKPIGEGEKFFSRVRKKESRLSEPSGEKEKNQPHHERGRRRDAAELMFSS